ncbi:MAG: single-stranded DNA-binding protein [Ruminococcus sp.]|nr:single-stranded DNA-binding protein [Ruminococcus sp.]
MNGLWVLGRITKIPEKKSFNKDGESRYCLTFHVADSDGRQDGFTQFIRCTIFGSEKKIEYYEKILHSGFRYMFVGKLNVNSYERTVEAMDKSLVKVRVPSITLLVNEAFFADKGKPDITGITYPMEPELDDFQGDCLDELPFE